MHTPWALASHIAVVWTLDVKHHGQKSRHLRAKPQESLPGSAVLANVGWVRGLGTSSRNRARHVDRKRRVDWPKWPSWALTACRLDPFSSLEQVSEAILIHFGAPTSPQFGFKMPCTSESEPNLSHAARRSKELFSVHTAGVLAATLREMATASPASSQDKPTLGEVIESIGLGPSQFKAGVLGGSVWMADGAELLLIGSATWQNPLKLDSKSAFGAISGPFRTLMGSTVDDPRSLASRPRTRGGRRALARVAALEIPERLRGRSA